MPKDNVILGGGKVIAGAAIFLMFFTILSIMSPHVYPTADDEEPRELSLVEKIKEFLTTFPYNFCIGGVLIILSIVGSYYSKVPAVAGDILRAMGPFQGYIFGFGTLLIFWPLI